MGKGFFRKRSFRKKKDSSYQDIGEDTFEQGGDGAYYTYDDDIDGIQPHLALTNTLSSTNDGVLSPRDIQPNWGQSGSALGLDVDGVGGSGGGGTSTVSGINTHGDGGSNSNSNSQSHNSNSEANFSVASQDVCLEELECLINDLASCSNQEETFGEKPARALRILFALSEHHDLHEINRIRMVREANGKLVPTLMQFLQICEPASSEQYLALLVLNNVSIPSENKRIVSIDHKGAHVLSRMLCWYPSCSLICIILVNLTFCEQSLRKQLVEEGSSIQLVEAFAYALKVRVGMEYEQRYAKMRYRNAH